MVAGKSRHGLQTASNVTSTGKSRGRINVCVLTVCSLVLNSDSFTLGQSRDTNQGMVPPTGDRVCLHQLTHLDNPLKTSQSLNQCRLFSLVIGGGVTLVIKASYHACPYSFNVDTGKCFLYPLSHRYIQAWIPLLQISTHPHKQRWMIEESS